MKNRAALFIAAIALNVCGCGFDLSDLEQNSDANSVFSLTFAQTVPSDVANLQAYQEGVSSSDCYLRFNAPLSTVKKLTGNSFTAVPESQRTQEWLKDNVSGIKPDWWQPLVLGDVQLFESPTFHPSYSSGNAVLFYNTAKKEAYLYWHGSVSYTHLTLPTKA